MQEKHADYFAYGTLVVWDAATWRTPSPQYLDGAWRWRSCLE
jgi:hypothetical protein